MKPVTFSGQNHTAFYKDVLLMVNKYLSTQQNKQYANTFYWAKLIFYYTAFVGTWFMAVNAVHWGWFMCWYCLNGLFVLGIVFNVAHDAAHNTVFKKQKWNKRLYYFSFPLLGNNPYVWRKFHIQSHHLYTNVEESDIDVVNVSVLRLNQSQPLHKYHKYQFLYAPFVYLFYTLNFIFIRDAQALFSRTQRTIHIQLNTKQRVAYMGSKLIFLTLFLLFPFLFASFSFSTVCLAFLLSQFVNSFIIILVLSCNHQVDLTVHLSHAEAEQQNISWVQLQLTANLDYSVKSRFFNFVVGGFNAHTVHHLLPHVNHIHYLKIVPIIQRCAQKHNVHYNNVSYIEALKSHFRFLYKMGQPIKNSHAV